MTVIIYNGGRTRRCAPTPRQTRLPPSGDRRGVSIIYVSFALICGYYLYGLFGLLGYDSQQLILVGAYTVVDPHINTNLPPRGIEEGFLS